MKKAIGILLITGALMGCVSKNAAKDDESQDAAASTLKSVYADDFLIGNIVGPASIDGPMWDLLIKQHNIATCENLMKPQYLQSNKGNFTFSEADAYVNKVIAGGLKMHGHTLAWHQQSPDWMNHPGIPRGEAVENLTGHAKTVAAHFKGRIISWDVLNEAINDGISNPSDWKAALRQSNWYKAIGADYIEIVFKAAREGDPDAKLYYNDYNLDDQNKALAVYNMVKEINERNPNVGGRPLIDGVGMQGHYNLSTKPENVKKSLEMFISLGVEVSVSELDIQAGTKTPQTEDQAVQQAILYAELFKLYKSYAANMGRVTMWGLNDSSSWRAISSPTMFDIALKAKPAFYAALDPDKYLSEHSLASLVKKAKQAAASYGTPKGITDAAWQKAQEIPVNQFLMAWQGATGTAKAMWDERNIYVLVNVNDANLDKSSKNAYEQDSVEVFIDENNNKSAFFQKDDGQYRVNFSNEASFNPESIKDGFASAAAVSGSSYAVQMTIPFRTVAPKAGTILGFDVQINDASGGSRQSVAIWNDMSGNSFQDTSGYGELRLGNKE